MVGSGSVDGYEREGLGDMKRVAGLSSSASVNGAAIGLCLVIFLAESVHPAGGNGNRCTESAVATARTAYDLERAQLALRDCRERDGSGAGLLHGKWVQMS